MFSYLLILLCMGFCLSALDPSVPSVRLDNGIDMPIAAFAANMWMPDICENATLLAIQAGFRFIWSSALVGQSCQEAQAQAISRCGVPRDQLFIAGTVNSGGCADAQSCYSRTLDGAKGQFTTLGLGHLDMIMLDYPAASCAGITGQWWAFEELLKAGKVDTIAVSNFSPDQLQCIASNKSNTVPAVNQMQYSVGHGGDTVVGDDGKFGTFVQAYSPLMHGDLLHVPLLIDIGKAHNKSSAQIALRWIVQHNATIATESTKFAHLKEDNDIFDFQLSASEMAKLDAYRPSLN